MPSLGETIRQALWLDESIYVAVQNAPEGIWYALIVVALASLSESVGQSVVLFLNRMRPMRFMFALGLSTLSHVIGFILWAVVVWLVGTFVFGSSQTLIVVASAVGLAYAPQLLTFFELTPFFGNAFSLLLTLWSMLAIIVGVRAGLGLETWQAIVASGLGWLLIQGWRRTLGRPIYALGHWVQRRAAGVPLQVSAGDVAKLRKPPRSRSYVQEWRNRSSPENGSPQSRISSQREEPDAWHAG